MAKTSNRLLAKNFVPRGTVSDAGFRMFLLNKVQFKQTVKIDDPVVIECIHLSYRLLYLKDTAMARFIDDTTSHMITQLVVSN